MLAKLAAAEGSSHLKPGAEVATPARLGKDEA